MDFTVGFEQDFWGWVSPNPTELPTYLSAVRPFGAYVWLLIIASLGVVAPLILILATQEDEVVRHSEVCREEREGHFRHGQIDMVICSSAQVTANFGQCTMPFHIISSIDPNSKLRFNANFAPLCIDFFRTTTQ